MDSPRSGDDGRSEAMTQDEAKQVTREFVGTMIEQARKLAAEGMSPEQAVDLVFRQAKLALAVGRINA